MAAHEVRLDFPLGAAYLEVAQLPGAEPKKRLEVFHRAQLQEILDLCRGIRCMCTVAIAFGMLRTADQDIDDAQASRDPESIREARSQEATLSRAAELIIASSDVVGQSVPSQEQLVYLMTAADRAAELRHVLKDAWGPRRKLRQVQARVKGKTLTVTFIIADTFDAGLYESLLAQDWVRSEGVADREILGQAIGATEDLALSLPQEMQEADRLFREATGGASFLQFLRVSKVLSDHPQDMTTVLRSNFSHLVSEVSERLRCNKSATRAALSFLTTSAEEARATIYDNSPCAGIETCTASELAAGAVTCSLAR